MALEWVCAAVRVLAHTHTNTRSRLLQRSRKKAHTHSHTLKSNHNISKVVKQNKNRKLQKLQATSEKQHTERVHQRLTHTQREYTHTHTTHSSTASKHWQQHASRQWQLLSVVFKPQAICQTSFPSCHALNKQPAQQEAEKQQEEQTIIATTRRIVVATTKKSSSSNCAGNTGNSATWRMRNVLKLKAEMRLRRATELLERI